MDYVTKPFDAFELRARVRAALRTKHLQDLLIEHAHIDPLTGLPNRRALMVRLQQEWARMERHGGTLSFVMADVDHFKRVNDTYGHSIGDRLLQEIAKTIAGQCRTTDLPARYGGEEFAIVVPDEPASSAARLAERCRQEIEKIRVPLKAETIAATASFGVADAQARPVSRSRRGPRRRCPVPGQECRAQSRPTMRDGAGGIAERSSSTERALNAPAVIAEAAVRPPPQRALTPWRRGRPAPRGSRPGWCPTPGATSRSSGLRRRRSPASAAARPPTGGPARSRPRIG